MLKLLTVELIKTNIKGLTDIIGQPYILLYKHRFVSMYIYFILS